MSFSKTSPTLPINIKYQERVINQYDSYFDEEGIASTSQCTLDPVPSATASKQDSTGFEADIIFKTVNIRGTDYSPDDLDDYLDTLPNFPMPPPIIPLHEIPLDDEFKNWLYSPPSPPLHRPSKHTLADQHSSYHRVNRFKRSLQKKQKGREEDYHRKALMNAARIKMKKLSEEGVDVTEWRKYLLK
jgi:hypothetical protein